MENWIYSYFGISKNMKSKGKRNLLLVNLFNQTKPIGTSLVFWEMKQDTFSSLYNSSRFQAIVFIEWFNSLIYSEFHHILSFKQKNPFSSKNTSNFCLNILFHHVLLVSQKKYFQQKFFSLLILIRNSPDEFL